MFAAPLVLAAALAAAPDHHLKDEAKKPSGTIVERLAAAVGEDNTEKPFVLLVSLTAKQGKAQDLIAAYRGAARKSLAEEGCKQYALVRDAENPLEFTLIERWTGASALNSHMGQDYTKTFVGSFGDLVEKSGVRILRPIGAGKQPAGAGKPAPIY